MEPLALRLPLSDSYYFIARDHMDQRGRLDPRIFGIGLAAGLLGELATAGVIGIHDGNLYVVSREPPADALLHGVAAQLLAQPQHRDLPTWMSYLAVTAEAKVADRLRMNRKLKEEERRRLIGKRRVLVPADRNEQAWQAVRLERLLNTGTPLWPADRLLAGIVSATGLMPHVLWDPGTNAAGYHYLPQAVAELEPPLLAIVKQTESAVGQAVLAPR
jgi:hypothetical protein